MVLKEADVYRFGFNHPVDINFECYIDPASSYMVSLMRISKRAQYGCLNILKRDEKSWEETLACIEQLSKDRRFRFIHFLYFFLRRCSARLWLGTLISLHWQQTYFQ